MTRIVGIWCCGNPYHQFRFGDEDWHYQQNQGLEADGAPIPSYCFWTCSCGECSCMDSSELYREE